MLTIQTVSLCLASSSVRVRPPGRAFPCVFPRATPRDRRTDGRTDADRCRCDGSDNSNTQKMEACFPARRRLERYVERGEIFLLFNGHSKCLPLGRVVVRDSVQILYKHSACSALMRAFREMEEDDGDNAFLLSHSLHCGYSPLPGSTEMHNGCTMDLVGRFESGGAAYAYPTPTQNFCSRNSPPRGQILSRYIYPSVSPSD